MEQRQDYTEGQIDLLSQFLRKLLERLLKIKSSDAHNILQEKITVCQSTDKNKELTIKDLELIENSLLISVLMNEYGYKDEDLKTLADILYKVTACDEENNKSLRQKALTFYEYHLANAKDNIHLSVFYRIQELKNSLQ